MTTQEKIDIALSMIASMQFQEDEKRIFIKHLLEELNIPLFDFFPEYSKQVQELLSEAIQKATEFLSVSQSQEKDLSIEIKRKTRRVRKKTSLAKEEKPVKLNKDGRPRKPYTRRKKEEPTETVLTEAQKELSKEETSVSTDNLQTTEEKEEQNTQEVQSQDLGEKIDGKILYQNPNNAKALIVSDRILPNHTLWGIVVPYFNKKGVFGISFYEEKKIITIKQAMSKAHAFPKFFGNKWEILNEKHKKSLIAAETKINKIIKKLHGDLVHGNYLTYPYDCKNKATIIRYAIELPGVTLEEE